MTEKTKKWFQFPDPNIDKIKLKEDIEELQEKMKVEKYMQEMHNDIKEKIMKEAYTPQIITGTGVNTTATHIHSSVKSTPSYVADPLSIDSILHNAETRIKGMKTSIIELAIEEDIIKRYLEFLKENASLLAEVSRNRYMRIISMLHGL